MKFLYYKTADVIALVLVLVSVIGWALNIIKLFQLDSVLTGEGALRIIGIIVAPLGVILGWVA